MRQLFTLIMLLAATVSAWAITFSVGDLKYETTSTSGQVWCTGLSDAGAARTSFYLIIPRKVTYEGTTYNVKRIGTRAFQDKTNIRGVRFEYGIERINSYAFLGCSNLEEIHITSSMTSIGLGAFTMCSKVKTVYYASTTPKMTLDSNVFPSNTGFTLYIPRGSKASTFRANSSYTSSTIPKIETSSKAFDFHAGDGSYSIVTKAATSASDDHSVSIIGFSSGTGNSNALQGIFIPQARFKFNDLDHYCRYVSVADSAFIDNAYLKSMDLTNATYITRIGDCAASNCNQLMSIKTAADTIGYRAFSYCSALVSVSIDGATSIGSLAFGHCTALTSITIPASVKSIHYAFVTGSTSLTQINVDAGNTNYSSHDYCLYSKDMTVLRRVPEGRSGSHVPRYSTTYIADLAYLNCTKITDVVCRYGLKTIGRFAFQGCSLMKEVRLPSSVTAIGYGAFEGCKALAAFNVNSPTAPLITKGDEFKNAGNPDLYVPRGMVDAYKNAGWTGFKSYNKNDCVAYDAVAYENGSWTGGYNAYTCLTVTSNKPEVINGTDYAGRLKVVRSVCSADIKGEYIIPPYIEINYKKYAITKIDDQAYNSQNEFSIKGCALVDTVGKKAFDSSKITSIELPYVSFIDEEAFDDCKSLTSAKWGNRLKRIEWLGFCNAPLEHNIILPVGFEYLGEAAFKEVKSKTILIPSTMTTCSKKCFYWMNNLTTIIMNATNAFGSSWSFDFTNVPSSATVYVPVGQVNAAKAHDSWKRFSNIQAGAFDFSLNADLGSQYTMTVTSNTPVTVGGVTYAGKAKYVYNPTVKSRVSYTFDNYETDKMCGGERKYLMTEIGDELAMNSNIQTAAFARMANLERIGTNAFNGSQLTTATMPDRPIKFGQGAFYGATKLTELIVPGTTSISWEGNFFGNNASDFNFFVDYSKVAATLNSSLKDYSYNSTEKCSNRVAPCFTALATTFNLGVNVPLDFKASNLNAYAVTGKDSSTGLLTSSVWIYTEVNDGGVIIYDLTPGSFYKVKRKFTDVTSSTPGLLRTTTTNTNVYNIANAYYWDVNNKKFVKPTGNYTITSGRSYLVINDAASELYLDVFPPEETGKKGDVNGDGTIDVTDVNLAINVMLGKATKSQYPKADVNGDGTVDVTDVNLIINAMLGK